MSYCTTEEVNSLFGDISDDIPDEMFETAIKNSKVWIESNLKRNYVPIPTEAVETLNTVAIYHSASDIVLSLYQGNDDLPVQYDIWFQKAQTLLDEYIEAYLNNDAENSDLIEHQCVKSRRAKT